MVNLQVNETSKYMPREKFVHSARRFFGRNYEGESAFRPLYFHDEAMRRIWVSDQIIRERTGEGTLVMQQPPKEEVDPADIASMETAAERWEGGRSSYLQIPFGWDIDWNYGGTPPDTEKAIQQHAHMIARMLEDTLSELGYSSFGARAVGQEMRTVTQRVLSGMCAQLATTILQQVIHPIYEMNGWDTSRSCYPHVSGFEDSDRLTRIFEFTRTPKPQDPLLALSPEQEAKLYRVLGLS
jgi:hypothetical protein